MQHLPYFLEAPLCRAARGARLCASAFQATRLVAMGFAYRVGRTSHGRVTIKPTGAGLAYIADLARVLNVSAERVVAMYGDATETVSA